MKWQKKSKNDFTFLLQNDKNVRIMIKNSMNILILHSNNLIKNLNQFEQ
jgi:hypothetical protein